MAIDIYLQIEGIKGESTDKQHEGWIECAAIHFGARQPKSATSSSSGGHTAERGELYDITINKLSDSSTPLLLQNCMAGKTIPKAKIEFMRADGNAEPIKYFEITLENIIIAQINPTVSEGATMSEVLAIKFSKVTWKYTKQKIGGGASGNTSGGWDCATNRICA